MPFISKSVLAAAIKRHETMSLADKEKVCDELFEQQPNLLGSVLVLPRMGVAAKYVDAVLTVLIVIHLAVNASGSRITTISEEIQERELQRFVGTAMFSDGLDQNLMAESLMQYEGFRMEPTLMAYVISILESTGIHADTNENTKYALMTAFTLVGCIANAQSQA